MPTGKGPALSPLKKKIEWPSIITSHSKAWDCGMLLSKLDSAHPRSVSTTVHR